MHHINPARQSQCSPAATKRAEAAAALARHGFQIGPLNGKAPYVKPTSNLDGARNKDGGFYSFTSDVEQVAAWWSHWPLANIGARPWEASVVIDVDTKNGAPGLEVWREINAGHHVPPTLTTKTGTGGFHFWFRLPYPAPLASNIGGRGAIDIKHHNGYVVMPPSVHPVTGTEYVFDHWCPPGDLPVLPKHLHRHVYAPAKPSKRIIPDRLKARGSGVGLVRTVAEAQPGNRNNALYWAACTAAKDGLNIFDELVSAAEGAGLSTLEAERTISSARMGTNGKWGAAS